MEVGKGALRNIQPSDGMLKIGIQGSVVGLEVELATGLDHTAVLVQEASVGQAALGVLLPGPGIGEVDKQPVDLLGGKNVLNERHIHINKEHIGKTHFLGLFHLQYLLE